MERSDQALNLTNELIHSYSTFLNKLNNSNGTSMNVDFDVLCFSASIFIMSIISSHPADIPENKVYLVNKFLGIFKKVVTNDQDFSKFIWEEE